jgi:hypothetical protein
LNRGELRRERTALRVDFFFVLAGFALAFVALVDWAVLCFEDFFLGPAEAGDEDGGGGADEEALPSGVCAATVPAHTNTAAISASEKDL